MNLIERYNNEVMQLIPVIMNAVGKRWYNTIASECRYGDIASHIFQDAEIIWENSSDDY
jgi:hypothetical protein